MASSPKRPEETAEEAAIKRRQASMLSDETEENEERLKAIARGKLGRSSLLTGAPTTVAQAARGGRTSASMFGGSTGGKRSAGGTSSGGSSGGSGGAGGGGGLRTQ